MNAVTSSLDKKMIIHIASELIILGGVTFWLNSKINSKDERISALEKENKELKLRLERIERFLSNAAGGPPPPHTPSPKKSKRKKTSPTTSEDESLIASSSDEEIEI
jgi:hypothetical protein